MVSLCTNSLQITMLEWALKKNDILYQLECEACDCGLDFPYLIVDGVPLDEDRAMKWIKEQKAHE